MIDHVGIGVTNYTQMQRLALSVTAKEENILFQKYTWQANVPVQLFQTKDRRSTSIHVIDPCFRQQPE